MTPQRHGRAGRTRWVAAGLLAAGVVAIAAAVVVHGVAGGPRRYVDHATPVVDRGALADTSGPASPPASRPPGSSETPPPHGLPAGSVLRYRRLHVTAPIRRTGTDSAGVIVPLDPRVTGWWRASASPGDPAGSVVIVGHVNYAGVAGALGVLPRARPGDAVTVTEPDRTARYVVTAVRTYPKTAGIPAAAFARSGPARLVLITCGGPFDAATGNYLDNVVVYASAVTLRT